VVVLTDANFNDLVLKSKDIWLVEFYAPWCGHCKSLEPEWNIAAGKLKGQVKLGKVDATVETGLGQRFGVKGYPTIKVFDYGEKSDSKATDY
jgi:protein disulfide-isomerase A6